MRMWFARLADEGTVTDGLQKRAWGTWVGSVVDRFGVAWLIGFQEEVRPSNARRGRPSEKP